MFYIKKNVLSVMSKSILIHMLKDVNLSGHQILIGDTR